MEAGSIAYLISPYPMISNGLSGIRILRQRDLYAKEISDFNKSISVKETP